MATIDGTYIPVANTGSTRKNTIMDGMISLRLEQFRQLKVHGEQINYGENALQSIWYPWLADAPISAERNSLIVGEDPQAGTLSVIDAKFGKFNVSPALQRGETLYITYLFDYFPDTVVSALIDISVDIINAVEPGTNYHLEGAPEKWNGAIAEQVYVLALEKLIFDDLLWKSRLVFADPDSVVSQLESAISGSRDRLTNLILPSLKKEPHISSPTWVYYDAIRMGVRSSYHGQNIGYGKTRGMRVNRWFGR